MMKNILLTSCCLLLFGMLFNTALLAENGDENFCFNADVPEAQANLGAMCLTAPTLFCPATYLGCPSDNLDPSNTGNPVAQPGDANCPNPIVSFTDEIVSNTGCLKIVHRTWEATYPPGSASIKLHSTCQQTLYLEDTTPPTIINCPNDLVIDLSTNCDSTATWIVPTAEDDCGIQLFVTTNFSGTTFPSGTTTVTYSATDFCGLTSTCSFNVTVTGSCCNAPSIACPADINVCPVIAGTTPSTTGVASATASDPSCGVPVVTFVDNIISTGPCSGEQQIQRTWTASDAGNSSLASSCNQIINVVDDTNPVISSTPSNITVAGNGSGCQVAVSWTQPTVTDNCNIATWSSNFNSGDTFAEGTTTVIYTAVDDCGNTATSSFTVTVDCVCNSAPTLTCPADYNACPTNTSTSPSVTGTATAVAGDPSCGAPIVAYTDVVVYNGPCANATVIERTWTATVANNNALTVDCVQMITLADNTAPQITSMPQDVTLNGIGANCTIPISWSEPTATDDCGMATFSSNFASGSSFPSGITTVVYTAVDKCGNATSLSFTVTVNCALCTSPPLLTCPADYNGCPFAGYPIPALTGTATATIGGPNCTGTPIVTYNDIVNSQGSCTNAYNITRVWTATNPNDSSLSTTCSQSIVVTDNGGPTLSNLPSDITVHATGAGCAVPVKWGAPTATDDCGVASINATPNNGSTFTEGTTTVVYTAIDNCGNAAAASFNVTVLCSGCQSPPNITCPSAYITCPGGMLPSPSIAGVATASAASSECMTPFVFYSDVITGFGSCAGAYTAQRTWNAFDPSSAQMSSCVQVIDMNDTSLPTIANVPQDITLTATGSGCSLIANWNAPSATDNCGIASLTSSHNSGSSFTDGTTTVTYTATDNCGNTNTATFNVTVECAGCNTPPAISCPANYTLCPASPFPNPSVSGVAAATAGSADCGTPIVSYNDVMSSFGTCMGAMTYQRNWTAADPDDSSVFSTCVQTITMEDNIFPVVTNVPADITVSGNGSNCQVPVTWNAPVATDNCGIDQISSNFQSGHTFGNGTTTVTYTITDNCGNASTAAFNVTVDCIECTTPPVISCPTNYTACISSATSPSITGVATAANSGANCVGVPNVTYVDAITNGACAGAQTIQRTWTAIDQNTGLSGSCVQTVSLIDNSAPAITNVPANITVSGSGAGCQVPVTWNAPQASDNCGTTTLTSNIANGTTFTSGTTTITYTAVDNCGNASTASFTVTVECGVCSTPPSITCPASFTTCATGMGIPGPTVTGFAYSVIDGPNCSGTPYMTYNDVVLSSGPCAGAMEVERTWIATDPSNKLQGTCVQHISIVDNSNPVISGMPTNITVSGTGSNCVVPVTWNVPTATDDCGAATLTTNHSNGSNFSEGTTTVIYTATDNCGNVTTASFTVTVQCAGCNTPPAISCPTNYTACPSNSSSPSITGVATGSNSGANCNGVPTITYTDTVLSNGPCNGAQNISRTWLATDPNSGLSSSCVQTINLVDNTPPVITNMPANIVVSGNGSGCSVPVTWTVPTATDNCGMNTAPTCAYTVGAFFNEGTTTVTYTATDNCGNTSSASFTITVNCAGCSTPPSITCPANYTGCPGISTLPENTGVATATLTGANCSGTPTISHSDLIVSTGPCTGAKVIQRTWTATDPNTGLTASCTQMITLVDNTAPVIANMPSNITVSGTGTNCSVPVTWTVPTATDNCGMNTAPTCAYTVGALFGEGTTTVTYTATDNCGNSSSASFTITVTCAAVCNTPPTITCPADYTTCPSAAIPSPSIAGQATAFATGAACGTPVVTYADVIVTNGPCPNAKHIERTWTATDPSNAALASVCIQNIHLIDNTPPVLANCPLGLVLAGMSSNTGSGTGSGTPSCTAIATWVVPTATDDCSSATVVCTDQNGTVVNSGDAFPAGTTIVTCTATDLCGNEATCAFDIVVTCNDDCTAPPLLTCPADATVCIGGDYSIAALGDVSVVTGPLCPAVSVSHADVLISSGPCAGQFVYNRTWTGSYPSIPGSTTSCTQVITIENMAPQFVGCPENIFVGDDVTPVFWTAPTLVDPCGTATVTGSHVSGATFPCGTTTVSYSATDACGNTITCSFDVIVNCVNGTGFTFCPSNQTLTCSGGGAVANWSDPIYNSTCSDCSMGQNIPGFIYMGTYGGSQYYCSISPATWPVAKQNCEASGGFLADVNSAEENNFLANLLTIQSAWIGLTDVNSEGTFEWCNGQPVTYTNWYTGQPNNFNNNQDFVEILSTGEWNDQYNNYALEYIMEIPCNFVYQQSGPAPGSTLTGGTYIVTYGVSDGCNTNETCSFSITVEESLELTCPADITVTAATGASTATASWNPPVANSCCSSCSSTIPGFVYMGSYNGHHYYCSAGTATWSNANAICAANGGYLASVNTAGENNFLANVLTYQSAWIGLNDVNNEGWYSWTDGSPYNYSNWYIGQPNNYNNNQDYVEMLSDGTWNDQYGYVALEFIMEVPDCISMAQSGGPASGSSFAVGTTTPITYTATDGCGNSETCTFNVTVEAATAVTPCGSTGLTSTNHYIESCTVGNMTNASGDNGGYGDFTNICEDIEPGTIVPIQFCPGFAGAKPHVMYWSCWIDFNHDGDFEDNYEFVAYGAGAQCLNGQITIPNGLTNGFCTMRITAKLGGYATDPCETYLYGETEDYCINIINGVTFLDGATPISTRANDGQAVELFADVEAVAASDLEINIYPNPVSNLMNVELSDLDQIQSIGLFDQSGRLVNEIVDRGHKIAVDVSQLPGGLYLLKVIKSDHTIETEKVIITR